jgi:hypothetical protein
MIAPRKPLPRLALCASGWDPAIGIAARDLARQGTQVLLCVDDDSEAEAFRCLIPGSTVRTLQVSAAAWDDPDQARIAAVRTC